MNIDLFIQARMSSQRLPGKVLKPISNIPLISWTIGSALQIRNIRNIVILTSTETSDDVISNYVKSKHFNVHVFRGPLNNVFKRFSLAIDYYKPDYILRICGDSPFVSVDIAEQAINKLEKKDLVTNIFPRTFPKGLSLELVKADLFSVQSSLMNSHQKENVTPYFYDNSRYFEIENIVNKKKYILDSYAIDTLDDYKTLTKFIGKFNIQTASDFQRMVKK